MTRSTIFLHIPRTGGTSFGALAYRLYASNEILEIHPATAALRILEAMDEERLSRFRFIRGHVPYGIDRFFPQRCLYVTILRDPVERVISEYRFATSSNRGRTSRAGPKPEVGLAEFAEAWLNTRQSNKQTRLLSGIGPWEESWNRDLDDSALDRALDHLEGVAAIGLTERFEESVTAIQRALGWPSLPSRKLNVNPEPTTREDIPSDVLRRIEELNHLDRELYERARTAFQSQAARGPSVPVTGIQSQHGSTRTGEGPHLRGGARVRHVIKQALPFGIVRWIQERRAHHPEAPSPIIPSEERRDRKPVFRAAPAVMRHLARMRDQGLAPDVVVDVGAAHGLWTRDCLQLFPDARYVLVEPLPDYVEELEALAADPRITTVAAAAGRAPGRLPLHVPDALEGASLLPAGRDLADGFFKRSLTVPVVRLDDLEMPGGSALLKLDVQGYELEVLAGAERSLSRTDVIVAECSLYRFQEDLPLLADVVDTLRGAGFALYDLGDEIRFSSGVLGQVDLIFVRENAPLRDSRWWILDAP